MACCIRRRTVRVASAALGSLLGLGSLAVGDVVCINSPTTITVDQSTIVDQCSGSVVPLVNAEIVVSGTELRIDGEHTIRSLTVQRNATNVPGVVTHSAGVTFLDRAGAPRQGMLLTITGDLSVQGVAPPNLVASRIDVSAKGSARSTGPGAGQGSSDNAHGAGAGYGGAGGNSASGRSGGACFGSVTSPTFFGSGGGSTRGNSAGSAGGGAAQITVGGVAMLNGDVWSDGQNGTVPNYADGGGSGGSVLISASRILGTGTVRANGGAGGSGNAGGGGGGRIALFSRDAAIELSSWQACGGGGLVRGGAGTVFVQSGSSRGTLYIANCGNAGEATEFTGLTTLDMNVVVSEQGLLAPAHGDDSLRLTVLGDLTIQESGRAGAPERGYARSSGPGAGEGSSDNAHGAGGAHGGAGGNSASNRLGGNCFGSVSEPLTMGSGGGATRGNSGGSAGGGLFRATITGTLTVLGEITADGQSGTVPNYADGGGAGGSIWISANQITGSGQIRANGGSGGSANAGGGGAGRIALYSTLSPMTFSNWQACGGDGRTIGGAGTVYVKQGTSPGTMYVNNCNQVGEATEFTGITILDMNVDVSRGGLIAPQHQDDTLHLTVTRNALIRAGDPTIPPGPPGMIGAPFRGHPRGLGFAAGTGSGDNAHGGGGGHGGAGGRSSSNRVGGAAYGGAAEPITMGSGGGATRSNSAGSAGGGSLRFTVLGSLTVNGEISADGQNGTVPNYADGGGAGGSLWIWANQILGTGTIHANGGNGGNGNAGGGGSGRIALYSCTQLPVGRVTVNGGTGFEAGLPGTIVRGANIRLDQPVREVLTVKVPHDAILDVLASSTRPPFSVSHTWQRFNVNSGLFENLAEGQDGRFFGVATRTLRVNGRLSPCGDEQFKCILTDTCGAMPAPTILVQFRSPADVDDGSGTGTPDGAVTIDDLLYYLPLYLQGDPQADMDDGLDSGDPDGGITIDDLLFFLQHLYAGC